MLRDALNKSWRDHVTNKDLYGKLPRITDISVYNTRTTIEVFRSWLEKQKRSSK